MDLKVRAPRTTTVNIAVQVDVQAGRDRDRVLAQVRQALEDWFTGRLLGQRILRARLGELIFHCEGVANYSIAAPAADVDMGEDQLPVLGTLEVEAKT